MKRTASGRNRIIGIISVALCLVGLFFSPSLGAEATTPLMLAFGIWTDEFYIGVAKNDGTPLMRYTQAGFALHPSLAPDGRSMFFCDYGATKAGARLQIYQLDFESRKLTPISDGSAVDEFPVCSPDGKQLAFISKLLEPAKDQDALYRVYISDISGKDRQPADPEGESPQFDPSWSPDGKKLVYTHSKFLKGAQLMVRDLEKKTTTKLLPFYIFAFQGCWSPKGDEIAYTDIVPLLSKKTIWVAKADGSDRRQITAGPDDQEPFWYPDGGKLLFSRNDGEREEGKPKRVICSIDLETRAVKKIISMDNGSVDCPRIVTLRAAEAPQQVSQSPAPANNKKQ